MKIIIDGVRYYTERSESICSRFSERATDFEIEQVQETLYRTDDGKYFSHIWKFEDSATKSYDEEDRLSESVRTMTLEDVITWFRTDGIARRFQNPPTTFSPIGNRPGKPGDAECLTA